MNGAAQEQRAVSVFDALPIASTRMRAEPPTADATRAGAEHDVALLGPADLPLLRFLK